MPSDPLRPAAHLRPLLGELPLLLLPALPALLLVALAGGTLRGLLLGLVLLLLLVLPVALWRARQDLRLAGWIGDRTSAPELEPPPLPDPGPGRDGMQAPLVELVRAGRLARRDARDSDLLLDQLITALPDPVLLVDRMLSVLRCNPAAQRSFRVPAPPLPLARLVRDPGVTAAVMAALDGEASNVAFTPADDRLKRFAARVEPVRLPDDRPGVLITLREQSEQVMIERIRSDFVANASHEIRTPLASVHGLIETLRGPAKNDAEAREMFLETMAEETERMIRLVEDLLSLSKIELAANQPPTRLIDPEPVIRRVVERLAPIAARRGSAIGLDLEGPLPLIRGDADQLHQLLVNLVDNAVKYGDGKPVEVEVRVLAKGPPQAGPVTGRPALQVAVVDHGLGIAAEHLPRLTERFYRVDTARSRRLGGTGLGLAIVKHILRRHQGHLLIESRPGQGSRFTVLLPTAADRRHETVTRLSSS